MFDSLKMMGKAREMQAKMQEMQARLPSLRAYGSAGGGRVSAAVSGTMELVGLEIAADAPLTDRAILADLVRVAVNDALKGAQAMIQKEMQDATGGIDLGAFKNMLGN